MPIIGPDLVLAGNPRFRIFSTISIGYGSVDRSDSSTDTSTSTSRLALVDRVLSAVRAPSAPYPPATYSEILAPACTGGRSGSLLLTQPDAACTVNGVASRSRNGPFCPKSVMRTTTRSGLSILNESASSPERSSVPGGSASTRRCARSISLPATDASLSRSTVVPHFPALRYSNRPHRCGSGTPPGNGPQWRSGSPEGGSILVTSAPR